MAEYPFLHNHLCDGEVYFKNDGAMQIVQKIHAQCVDMTEKAIVEAITRTAKEAGITDLYLLDKKFVVNALKKAIDEQENKAPKWGEWISVKDRLPEEDTRVLVYLDIKKLDANTYTFFDTDRLLGDKWVRWNSYISHWMPLPEPPYKGE